MDQQLKRALEIIAGWSDCQCDQEHGDNPNCCVLIAEMALQEQPK